MRHERLALRAAEPRLLELAADGRNRIEETEAAFWHGRTGLAGETGRRKFRRQHLHERDGAVIHDGDRAFGRVKLEPAHAGEKALELGINPVAKAGERVVVIIFPDAERRAFQPVLPDAIRAVAEPAFVPAAL